MGGFSIWHWLIVLAIVVLVFGTKKLTSGARDLGNAVNEFKKGMSGDSDKPQARLGDGTGGDTPTPPAEKKQRDNVVQ